MGASGLNYADYIGVFNSGDDERLIRSFYAEDCVFTGGSRLHRGHEGLREFLNWAHDGVREVMRPQTIMEDERSIFVEVDMDFHAAKERPDFPFGHLRPGDTVTVKFFVLYTIENGKIVHLKSMTWPPEWGVTKQPRLGGHPGQRAAFIGYTQAFSNADHERFSAFYTEDVSLYLSSMPPIHGRQGIVDFYSNMFQTVRETLIMHSVVMDDGGIAGDFTSRFTALADAPDFVVMPLRAGEYCEVRVFVHYKLRDGLIEEIRVARAGDVVGPSRA